MGVDYLAEFRVHYSAARVDESRDAFFGVLEKSFGTARMSATPSTKTDFSTTFRFVLPKGVTGGIRYLTERRPSIEYSPKDARWDDTYWLEFSADSPDDPRLLQAFFHRAVGATGCYVGKYVPADLDVALEDKLAGSDACIYPVSYLNNGHCLDEFQLSAEEVSQRLSSLAAVEFSKDGVFVVADWNRLSVEEVLFLTTVLTERCS